MEKVILDDVYTCPKCGAECDECFGTEGGFSDEYRELYKCKCGCSFDIVGYLVYKYTIHD